MIEQLERGDLRDGGNFVQGGQTGEVEDFDDPGGGRVRFKDIRQALRVGLEMVRATPIRDLPQLPAALKAIDDRITALSRDDYTPEGDPDLDKHDQAVLDAASGLAGDDQWSDEDAVRELQRLAKRHPDSLSVAEIASRSAGRYQDFAIDNRAQRLLRAALTGGAVQQPSPSDLHRFEIVEEFAALPIDQAWEELVTAVPSLYQLAEQRKAGTFALPAELLDRSLPREVRRDRAREHLAITEDLNCRLDAALGPRSGQTDALLGSAYAREFAVGYLISPEATSS
jgi:hypothetical protein